MPSYAQRAYSVLVISVTDKSTSPKKTKNILVRKGRSGAVVVELVTWQVASRRAALLTRTHYCSLVVRLSESSLASRELLLLLLFF